MATNAERSFVSPGALLLGSMAGAFAFVLAIVGSFAIGVKPDADYALLSLAVGVVVLLVSTVLAARAR